MGEEPEGIQQLVDAKMMRYTFSAERFLLAKALQLLDTCCVHKYHECNTWQITSISV